MKERLETLETKIMTQIEKHAAERDLSAIGDLYGAAREIGEYKDKYIEMERLVLKLEARFNQQIPVPYHSNMDVSSSLNSVQIKHSSYAAPQTKEKAKKIRIEIDWSRLGKPGDQEVISEHMASASLELFLRKLASVCGISILERLKKLHVSRGPMVTDDPKRDYVNSSNGAVYANQSIGDTGFFVLTNTSTPQKVADVTNAMKFLGLPFGFVRAAVVSK